MTKTICDICGKEMPTQKPYANFRNFNFCISSNGRTWDICNECRVSLDRWITTRKRGCDEKECANKAESEGKK